MQINHQARAAAAENRRRRTRARLIDAAMRVIADKGPGGISVSEIAEASGLSRGAFYNYFPQPDELLAAVTEKIVDDLRRVGRQAVVAADDPAEQIARACLGYFELGRRDPVWGWVWLQLDMSSRAPVRLVTEGFEMLFKRGVEIGRFRQTDPVAACSVTFGAMRMAARLALTSAKAPSNLGSETVKIVLMGLGLRDTAADAVLERARRANAAA